MSTIRRYQSPSISTYNLPLHPKPAPNPTNIGWNRVGPVNSTLFLVLYLYNSGFRYFKMGYAATLAWMLFVIVLALTGLQFMLSRRWVYYESGGEGTR